MNKLKIMYKEKIIVDNDRTVIIDHFYNQMTLNTQKYRN
jgi:hypothetical protein